jgi:ribosomal protein L37AE/L43A
MDCKCGGQLKRVAIDCYQCARCGLKYKAAIAGLDHDLKKIAKALNKKTMRYHA